MPKLTDFIDPTKLADFVQRYEREEDTPEHEQLVLQAERDLQPVLALLPCSNNSEQLPCDCIVGTLLLLDLYLRESDKEAN